MNKVSNNKLSSVRAYFDAELKTFLGNRACKNYFELCVEVWLGLSRSDLILRPDVALSESEILKFLYAVKKFKQHEPIGHVLGEQFFYDSKFKVNEHVLIPRPETEELVDLIIKENKNATNILDVGTGSGCIAVSLKMALPKCQVTGIDISEKALEVARANGVLNEVQVSFHHGDAMKLTQLEEVNKKWDVVVSNPPYIPIKEKALMDRNVVDYDPSLALFVPNDKPLMYYDSIAKWAFNILQKKGALYFEIHENFGSEVSDLLINLGFLKVSIIQDLQGKDRIVKAII